MNTWDYIERVRAKNGGAECSDYRISKLLGITTAAMSNYKAGNREADDEVAAKIAAVLVTVPAARVIADIRHAAAEASGNMMMAGVWQSIRDAFKVVTPLHLPQRAALGGAPMMLDGGMVKTRKAASAHKKAASVSGGCLIFDFPDRPGSDGRNRTADLGVMNPSL